LWDEDLIWGGIEFFDSVREIEDYFYDIFQELYGIPDQAMYYFDVERFIRDLGYSGEIYIYDVGHGYIFVDMGNLDYDKGRIEEYIEEMY